MTPPPRELRRDRSSALRQLPQCPAHDFVERCRRRERSSRLDERSICFVRAKAERGQREASVGVDVVATPVGFELRRRSRQHERPFVHGAVMAVAKQHQILGFVSAAELARHDVVDLEVARRAATGHATASTVATMHESRDARRHVLHGAARFAIGTDALCIALGACDVGRIERQLRAGTVSPALLARLADRRLDLVLRAAGFFAAE
ncbi:MAG TPA: hypothetical protein VGG74_10435, partial [Kofleriaceae bacterium]